MEDRASKRQRLHSDRRGKDDYLPGNITEIEIHNFMTYDHLVSHPGSRLNLVIGPNGSGKSSLVCAIALGLAGEPQILGRASSVGAFVKRGEESGYVKISLRGWTPDEKICITRKIDTQNKSEWLFNGKPVPKRDVVEIIQKFNIQVNNLTQFLPQDRVCEFAKLTPIQLLEETEKAVGDPKLPIQHHDLVEKSQQMKKLEVTVKQNKDTLGQLKALNAEQEKDVKRVRKREKLLAKVDSMKKKLPWLSYDLKKTEYKDAQKQEVEAKKNLDEAAKLLKELNKPIEEKKATKVSYESSSKKINSQITQNAKQRTELMQMETDMERQVRSKYKDIDDTRRQEETRQQRITKAREDLVAAERELADLPIYEPPKEELERLGSQILELNMNANQKRMQGGELERLLQQKKLTLAQHKERLREMEDKNNKLLQALRNSGADRIVEAFRWLQEHRSECKKEVFGPVLLEVTVQDQLHAGYLEGHVPNYIWKSFITQDPSDRDFLFRNLKPFDIPVLNFVDERGRNKEPFQITDRMRELGIYSRLDQVFDAPKAVKDVLISQANLENSYIGSRETDEKADGVNKLGIMDIWTPESHYRWNKSRYGGHISGSVEPVQRSRLFMCSSDVGDVESLRSRKVELERTISELEENRRMIQTEQRALEDEAAKLQRERETIHNKNNSEKKRRRDMENRVDQRRRNLQSMGQEEDINLVIKKYLDEAAQLNDKRFKLAMKQKNLLAQAVAFTWSIAEKHLMSNELDAKIKEMEIGLKHHEKNALQASTNLDNCKTETEEKKQQLSAAKHHAESIAIITEELVKEFLEMPGTIEELDAAIQDTTSEANSILFVNQNILHEYENRQRKIDEMSTKVAADDKELQKCLAEIDNLKGSWLPTLRNLVDKINETFSRNFQEMAVAGEVSLDEQGTDFDKYGVLIKVKFREAGQLQVLSAHHQSGGERSVSTILYLVSLQDLTNCPFRVVDEINQGMDPINERKMFQQLVRAASRENTPQCFLLTPKLLPDLDYSDACTILTIMNGPYIEQPSAVWRSGENWGVVTGLTGHA